MSFDEIILQLDAIEDKITDLENQIEENNGVLTPEYEAQYDSLIEQYEKIVTLEEGKIDAYGFEKVKYEKEIEGLKGFRNSIRSKISSKEKSLARLKNRIALILRQNQYQKVKGSVVSIKDTSKEVNIIIDEEIIPTEYKKAILKIPFNIIKDNPTLEQYIRGYEVDKEKIDELEEPIPGVARRWEYTATFYGTKNLDIKNNQEEVA